MNPGFEIKFLRNLQRLLEEGEFVATYKFALLQALADLSVEREFLCDQPLKLPVDAIAEKFVEYYWGQAMPYSPDADRSGILRQNTGK